MTKTLTYFFILFFLTTLSSFAQTGVISGTIKTSDGRPAEWVNIAIKGTNKGATSDKNGNFKIRNVEPGMHTIIASFIGLEKQEQAVDVKSGETASANFILKENSAQLQEVIVSTRNSNKENTVVAKMPLKYLENPQVYSSVSSELLKQQVITTYDDALRNVPGITRTWESTGRAGDGAAYFALRGFDAQPALTNGLPGLTSGNLDPSNIEEIQVIKGPSGTLFGASFYSYGGIINTVTKKPHFDFAGEATYTAGSFGLNRVTVDLNTPLGKQERIAMRVNAAYHTENSFQNAGFKKSFFISPSLVYEVNKRLSFHLLTEILEEERAVAPVFFHSDRGTPLPFKTLDALNLNNDLSFMSNDITIKNPRFNLQGQMLYKISDQWTSQTVVSRGTVKSNGYYTYIWDDENSDEYFDQYFHKEQQIINTTDIQQNFNGDFKIGNMRNQLLVGLDFFSRNIVDNGSGWDVVRKVTPQAGEVEYIDPNSGDTIAPVFLSQALVDNVLSGTNGSNSNITNSSYSAYVSNVLSITPGLMVMASLRADYFDSKGEKTTSDGKYDQFALSPKFGLVYQPILNKISVFANYMNAFFNKPPQTAPTTKSFKPEHADQLEFGVKTNLFSDRLTTTLSYYDIKVSDRIYPDPNNMNNSLQGGKAGSKGFEIELSSNPLQGLNIIAGYSHNETKVISGNENDFYNEPGRSPGGQGPQDLVNLWATYKFNKGTLKDFGFGIGGNYASRYKVIDNTLTGDFYLPSYTLINGSVFYNAEHFRVTLNVNNLSNTEYYIGYWSVNPQRPRNVVASVAYKF